MVMGFRAFTDGFAYVVLEGTQSRARVLAKDRLCVPQTRSWPACLAWVRKQLAEIVHEYNAEAACIKTIEPVAKKKTPKRLQIEAVILEYWQSERSIDCGTKVKSQLKRDIVGFTDAARYLDRVLTESKMLADLIAPQYQEAAWAAISELPEG